MTAQRFNVFSPVVVGCQAALDTGLTMLRRYQAGSLGERSNDYGPVATDASHQAYELEESCRCNTKF